MFIKTEKAIYEVEYTDRKVTKSENLKDLIDLYIIEYNDGSKLTYSELECAIDKAKRSEEGCEIYGAIWAIGNSKEPILKSVTKLVNNDLILI